MIVIHFWVLKQILIMHHWQQIRWLVFNLYFHWCTCWCFVWFYLNSSYLLLDWKDCTFSHAEWIPWRGIFLSLDKRDCKNLRKLLWDLKRRFILLQQARYLLCSSAAPIHPNLRRMFWFKLVDKDLCALMII